METITLADLPGMFGHVGEIMAEHSEELCGMDARMGDGDLGITMKKGFQGLPALLDTIDEPDIGKCLMKLGMGMSSLVPSTMGTLMASGIMGGGKAVTGRTEMGAKDFAEYLNGFANGVIKRGKCGPGDCTVLDVLLPAAASGLALVEEMPDAALCEVARRAYESALEGLEATKGMLPKFGKAAVFAERASGVADQGAYAGVLMIRGYCEYINR